MILKFEELVVEVPNSIFNQCVKKLIDKVKSLELELHIMKKEFGPNYRLDDTELNFKDAVKEEINDG